MGRHPLDWQLGSLVRPKRTGVQQQRHRTEPGADPTVLFCQLHRRHPRGVRTPHAPAKAARARACATSSHQLDGLTALTPPPPPPPGRSLTMCVPASLGRAPCLQRGGRWEPTSWSTTWARRAQPPPCRPRCPCATLSTLASAMPTSSAASTGFTTGTWLPRCAAYFRRTSSCGATRHRLCAPTWCRPRARYATLTTPSPSTALVGRAQRPWVVVECAVERSGRASRLGGKCGCNGPERHPQLGSLRCVIARLACSPCTPAGWPSVDAYYEGSSSARRIPGVAIPLLCIQAANDPIAPAAAIPYAAIRANPNVTLAVTPCGGHLGWAAGPGAPWGHPWTDGAVTEWLASVLIELLERRRSASGEAACGNGGSRRVDGAGVSGTSASASTTTSVGTPASGW